MNTSRLHEDTRQTSPKFYYGEERTSHGATRMTWKKLTFEDLEPHTSNCEGESCELWKTDW